MISEKVIPGQSFGDWTVIEQAEDYVSPKGIHQRQWLCECSCGEKRIVNENRLKAGRSKSCGHPEDIKDMPFGLLTSRYKVDDKIESNGKHRTQWYCDCKCGGHKIVTMHDLKSGKVASCGCLQRQMYNSLKIDIAGQRQRNGYLEAVKEVEPTYTIKGDRKSMWLCKCLKCNHLTVVSLNHFTQENTKSCGCIKRSYGESIVEDYLVNHNFTYAREVYFKDLYSDKKRPLRYDFGVYIDDRLQFLIEYNGEQHYQPSWSSKGMSKEEQFEVQQFHDELKREYTREHDIKLIEVPYTLDTYEKVEEFLLKELSLPDKS